MERRHTRRWPDALHHDGREFLTTAQVSKLLGVKPQSVYAYVSRGHLTSVRISGIRGSLFPVDAIEAFRARTARPPAGVVERIRTDVTLLEDDTLFFRGRNAVDLARTTDFLDVARLLWGVADAAPPAAAVDVPEIDVPRIPGRRLDTIRVVTDLLGAADTSRLDLSTPVIAAKATAVLRRVVHELPHVGSPDPTADTVAQQLWPSLSPMKPTPTRLAALNTALVLLADHDLSAGTIAARVAASARGSIHAVISAGLGAFDGPLHGGATTLAYEFLASVLADPDGPEHAVDTHNAGGAALPGCGHIVYRHRDPRAEAVLSQLETHEPRRDVLAAVAAVRRGAANSPSGFVNSDLALAAFTLRYRMVPDAAETIFAVARIAGWVAHAIEEYREPRLRFRPEGVYTGVRPHTRPS